MKMASYLDVCVFVFLWPARFGLLLVMGVGVVVKVLS